MNLRRFVSVQQLAKYVMDDYAEIARLGPANAVRVQIPARTEEDNNAGEVPQALANAMHVLEGADWLFCYSSLSMSPACRHSPSNSRSFLRAHSAT